MHSSLSTALMLLALTGCPVKSETRRNSKPPTPEIEQLLEKNVLTKLVYTVVVTGGMVVVTGVAVVVMVEVTVRGLFAKYPVTAARMINTTTTATIITRPMATILGNVTWPGD